MKIKTYGLTKEQHDIAISRVKLHASEQRRGRPVNETYWLAALHLIAEGYTPLDVLETRKRCGMLYDKYVDKVWIQTIAKATPKLREKYGKLMFEGKMTNTEVCRLTGYSSAAVANWKLRYEVKLSRAKCKDCPLK